MPDGRSKPCTGPEHDKYSLVHRMAHFESLRITMKAKASSLLLLLASCAMTMAITVRETETPLLSIHRPIDKDKLAEFLAGSRLVPDVYSDGKAYIQVSIFYISRLEQEVNFLGFKKYFMSTGMSSWCMRVSAYVKDKVTGTNGYVILSADFERNFSGMIMTAGCKKTQVGTKCGAIGLKSSSKDGEHSIAVSAAGDSNRGKLLLEVQYSLTGVEQVDFMNWANERYVRFRLSEDKHTLLSGDQPEAAKTWKGNKQVVVSRFYSSVFNAKFSELGWYELDDNASNPCADGYCFFSSKAMFVDIDATPMPAAGPANDSEDRTVRDPVSLRTE